MRMEARSTCFLKWSLAAIAILSFTDSVFIPLVVYRICYQSTSTFVPSQCVNCPFLALQGYSFSCFGTTAVPRNMTPTQAQCLIQRCQNGVKQTPVYLGRKKRDSSSDSAEIVDKEDKQDSAEIVDKEDKQDIQVVGQIDVLVDSEFDYEEMFE